MHERTANNSQSRISPELQAYINELVKEVVLNGKDFNSQKKWLKKYVEVENGDFDTLNENLIDFFDLFSDFKKTKSSVLEKFIRIQVKLCYIKKDVLEFLFWEIKKQELQKIIYLLQLNRK